MVWAILTVLFVAFIGFSIGRYLSFNEKNNTYDDDPDYDDYDL